MSLATYARELVARQPEPPRQVPLGGTLRRAYGSGAAIAMLAFAVLAGLPATIGSFLATGPDVIRVFVVGVCGIVTLLFAGAPALGALRFRRALATGIAVNAEILTVRQTPPRLRGDTIEASTHGLGRGTRRVDHPRGSFDERFETDAAWAAELAPGLQIRVLANPKQRATLLDLGPVREPR